VEEIIKMQNIQINAAAKQKQHRNKMMKPQASAFSRYCEDNRKNQIHFNTTFSSTFSSPKISIPFKYSD
jgi:hypothetical protein